MTTIVQRFLETCDRFPDREAMRIKAADGWEIYSYGDLKENVFKAARWLSHRGLKNRDRVALVIDNGPFWGIFYFGILLVGGIVVPLDPQASPKDIAVFLEDAGVKFIINPQALAEFKSMASAIGPIVFPHVQSDDTAALIYSSGTTANPKGIELTHRNFLANLASLEKLGLCSQDDVFVSILPLFHAFAFTGTLLFPLCLGAKVVYPNTKKSRELLDAMKETGVTVMAGVPELLKAIHKSISDKLKALPAPGRAVLGGLTAVVYLIRRTSRINLNEILYRSLREHFGKSLRFFVSGGARLDPRIARDFERWGFTVLEGYGLTETSPIVSINLPDANKIGSVGRPVDGVEVKIAYPSGEGGRGADGGEILIRGNNVMKGYYKKPRETAEVIKDGWFHSGDLGFIDKDGFIFISGRLKEMIVLSSGKNIFPEEIEAAYRQSPFIKETGVFLPAGDESVGLRAVIVPNFEEFQKKGLINVYEKVKWDVENISKGLTGYKRIMGFVISREELPKTRLEKIKRFQLEDIYNREDVREELSKAKGGQKPSETDPVIDSPAGRQILNFLRRELGLDREINPSDHLELDLGVDSLTRVELAAGLEKMFRIRIPDEILAQVATVRDAVTQITNLLVDQIPASELTQSFKISWTDILDVGRQNDQFANLDLAPGWGNRMLAVIFKSAVYLIFKIFCRLKIYGLKNLPRHGPYILCCNHSSYLDAFIVIAAINNDIARQTYFIGAKEIFCHPAVRWSMKLAHLVPIDAAGELTRALQSASYLLKNDKVLCIFPEGQRSIDGEVKPFKKGVGILARELNVDLVPVAIDGAFHAWPRTVTWPKPYPIRIRFGLPQKTGAIVTGAGREDDAYALITKKIQHEVIILKNNLKD